MHCTCCTTFQTMESEYVPSQHWGEVYLAGRENKQHIAKYLIVYICNLQHMILHIDACRTLNPFQNNNNIFTINAILCSSGNMVVSKRFDSKICFSRIFVWVLKGCDNLQQIHITFSCHKYQICFIVKQSWLWFPETFSNVFFTINFLLWKIQQQFSIDWKCLRKYEQVPNQRTFSTFFSILFLFLFCIYMKALQDVINKNERQNKCFGASK